MILALAVTAPALQATALRDAICKHVSFRPSIRVQIPVSHHLFQASYSLLVPDKIC
jgi:hypothetical protein